MKHRFSLLLFIFGVFSVFLWSYSRVFFKDFGEILRVDNSAVKGDGLYLKMRGLEQMRCVLHSSFRNIIRQVFFTFLFEYGGKIARAYLHSRGDGGKGKRG